MILKYYLKDIALKFNISESQLRFYDEKGVINKFKRDENNYRYLLEDDLRFVETIICLKKTSMPLKEIIKYIGLVDLGDESLAERQAMILKQEKVVLKNQKDIQEQIDFIEYKKQFYEDKIKNR
ncbi:MerR family transcriptional regulator [Spiroplasma endosymbiont of Panorpa germanica]|uniref:MerR family transcriptional regulator n=1 Tax=Spiroplasma endosymbiont of Panorpa germanica TaxID=3066314 RepID=UPI0030CFE3FB